jgi:hypothetical protein
MVKNTQQFKYVIDAEIPDQMVKSVRFDLSRYGDVQKVLVFEEYVTVLQAIWSAEKYLSFGVTD